MEEVSPNPPPTRPPHLLDPRTVAVLAAAAVFVGFLASGVLVQSLNAAFGIWFTQIFVFLGLGWFVLRATGREPVRYTGLTFPGLAPVAFGFALGVANFFAIIAPIQYVSQSLLPQSWREIYDVADIFRGQSPVEMAFIVASVTIAAPVCEEFFFRGVFFQGLRAHGGPAMRALLFSAVVFSAFHLDPVGFLARVELGMLFGWLLVRTGSLWPAILAHTANNLVSTVLFFVARHFESPEQPATQEDPRGLLILVALGCAALYALMAAAHRFPSLLGPPRPPEVLEAPENPVPLESAPRLLRLAFPWLLAATLSLGAYRALDPIGIQLSQIDMRYPLQSVPEDAPDALQAEREALFELRVRARRGEIPLGEYAQERARQSKQKRTDDR
ncbi:type II CAAX endopeptidase family protein [Archangium lansingense]|uniref:Type II CAAX endopeptidase family protein n=1 Tax=Archangium lansingense TaxID=2995310 RepID=A0ABT4ABL8_9BACT|nr:type II CAAX endopeptidase family protein [Archangium lansinium]MCY1079073.1 type II CAAX endopeptidase family protein [Archangium lansinium]